jgi:hypothetical protein
MQSQGHRREDSEPPERIDRKHCDAIKVDSQAVDQSRSFVVIPLLSDWTDAKQETFADAECELVAPYPRSTRYRI